VGAGNNIVSTCYIGLDHTGTVVRRNGGAGVLISGSAKNWIGFPQEIANVIAGNRDGIRIEGAGSDGNILLHNSVSGSVAGGIVVLSGIGNIIAEGGVSKSGLHGLVLGPDSAGAVVQYVFISDNAGDGILISGSPENLIGGDDGFLTTNVIDRNTGSGVHIAGGATGNAIVGNLIGTEAPGVPGFGNLGAGILIENSSNNVIGGPRLAGNAIAYNGGPGISIVGMAVGNRVTGNAVFSNTGLGIDLGGDGITLNHSGARVGPNNFLNYPVLTGASSARRDITVEGNFDGLPGHSFTIEVFASPACHAVAPNDAGEGRAFLGSVRVEPGSTGTAAFGATFELPTRALQGPVFSGSPTGGVITATATDEDGNTSEFSNCFSAVPGIVVPSRPLPREVKPRPGGS
jgi:hypothetical protein